MTESLLTPAFSPLFYDTFVAFLAVFSESGDNHGSAMLVHFTSLVANGDGDVVSLTYSILGAPLGEHKAMSSKEVLLARQSSRNAILCPTKRGFMPCLLPWDLWAFRVDRF